MTASYIHVSSKLIGFRESAEILRTIHQHKCKVTIIAHNKLATDNSISSLVTLCIRKGDIMIIKAIGEDPESTISDILKVS